MSAQIDQFANQSQNHSHCRIFLVNMSSPSNYPCIMNTILLFAALLFGTFLHGADAASVVYTGSVTPVSPKWTRPTDCDSGTPGSLVVGYTVEPFNVLTTGSFDIMITVNSAQQGFDGYILVYQDVFDPMVPPANLLGCNDDAGLPGSSSVTVNLQCGTQYFVVTTAYDGDVQASQFGTFTNTISGHADAEPVLGPLDDSDADGDGVTDVCDIDVDGDGIDNDMDNCPMDANANQEDLDGDGIGNVCDPDVDGDGIDNGMDNCPMDANANQEDLDVDGIGNVCDPDGDGDGIDNGTDKCPLTPLNERPVTLKGCSINQLCPCKGGWSKHELYIACIARVTTRFKNVGVITGREKREIQNKGAGSACGKHNMHENLPKQNHYY